MKTNKKWMSFVLLIILVMSLTGCADTSGEGGTGTSGGATGSEAEDSAGNASDNKSEDATGNTSGSTADDTDETASDNAHDSIGGILLGGNTGIQSRAITSQDYQAGIGGILKTDKGYYYYHPEQGFQYYDVATDKEIPLCNKPECKHDGNPFCVATNDKYKIDKVCMYDGKIYATAMEETGTQYLYKLLSIEPDGSELNEVLTYLTTDKGGLAPSYVNGTVELFIHRNKVLIPFTFYNKEWLEANNYFVNDEEAYNGAVLVDLDTGKVTSINDELLTKGNLKVNYFKAYGDGIYFCRREGRRNVLNRYDIEDGTMESYKLQVGFSNIYAVGEGGKIGYIRSGGDSLWVHDPATGKNEEKMKFTRVIVEEGSYTVEEDGETKEVPWTIEHTEHQEVINMKSDGEYLYLIEAPVNYWDSKTDNGWSTKYFRVLNMNFEQITEYDMTEIIDESDSPFIFYVPSNGRYGWLDPHFQGEEIYFKAANSDLEEETVYKCMRSALLNGEPLNLEKVFQREYIGFYEF